MTDRPSIARLSAAALLAALPAVAIATSFTAWGEVGELAVHWDARGQVDGVVDAFPVYLLAQVVSVLGFLVAVPFVRPAVTPLRRRAALLASGSASGVAMAVWLVPAGLTNAAGDARGAELNAWFVPLVAFLFYGLLLRSVVPRPAEAAAGDESRRPLPAGAHPAWSRLVVSVPMVGAAVVAAGALGIGVVAALDAGTGWAVGLGVVAAAVVVAVLSLAFVRVTVDHRGLSARPAAVGPSLVSVPLGDVLSVQTVDVAASEWGGWGVRRRRGEIALVLRSGPGMKVERRNGRAATVTLSDPGEPAAVLRQLLDRAR
ncbi:hypothetical protein AA0Y32_17560 [Georgenia phoenicis]|uniref:hypothetical protein n=1 Tax=unclassified Georgenia TaxID=2626815 RepID=UPI0039B07E0C